MAAPITHIVLAEKVFNKYFPDRDKKQFYVGTSFPDIRYFGGIDREKTHFSGLTLKEFVNDDSFIAGVKFHSLVDILREKYMRERGLYSLFPESEFLTQAAKVFEDRILYRKIDNWKKVVTFFNDIQEGELKYDLNRVDIEKWHSLLRNYLRQPPNTDAVIEKYISDMGRPKEMADKMISVLQNIKQVDVATKIINDFYDNFESLVDEKPVIGLSVV
ncbi:TPA: hypothetical protein DCP77_00510 [Candidatus Collierbacteria bacterium]|uniref:Uncharacterized protein n=1 Tax=Candidatus Collierbacteria bacterium GW2011_GWA2_42_17 TaxID=1618378 RepID=A0A0G0Z3I1_9BACT|nr:MAG: hypothetical protein UU94_C0005G0006 [Candidatus Collierbacteria bacterium GW2011_GWB2_42_12]KKS43285.1 MAG: hypothetical protein UV06_C0001G0019 [Candidatus Collierbacteria bacterium GW2011_GWA2_42_17]KKS67457.1 MAG: hypothetical protein UV37_C0006G0047 [Candidatus Collierbacteria bacterium GW2011_GWA1_42_60]HAI22538.1 hypothetical protein [Candidatus Collierbacteria bacterium]HAN22258.1 hypothetical protein [Candidatus Collierbacteria bacterium]